MVNQTEYKSIGKDHYALQSEELRSVLSTTLFINPKDDGEWNQMIKKHRESFAWPHLEKQDFEGVKTLWMAAKDNPPECLPGSRNNFE